VRDSHRNARVAGRPQHEAAHFVHVRMNGLIILMMLKKLIQRLYVAIMTNLRDMGNPMDFAAKASNFIVEHTILAGEKIKLDLIAVDMPVQIH
jgi:hypothetical protein